MKFTAGSLILLGYFFSSAAMSATVFPGCAAPALKTGHRTFYVDPLKGTASGDGSVANPWKSLADVLNPANKLIATQSYVTSGYLNGTDRTLHPVNPTAPIKPGDLILLMSGNHGALSLGNMFNADFITLAAAPGQTPVIQNLAMASSAKWMFQGVKFQGAAVTGKSQNGIVNVGSGNWLGAASDVVFDNDSFSATDDTSSWSAKDWVTKPWGYGLWIGQNQPCVSVTNSHFYNVMNAIDLSGNKTVAQGNLIERMANDGIEITASDQIIKNNTIVNGMNDVAADPLHADGIQGWSATVNGTVATNSNVTIDGNTIVKTGDTAQTYMQGISIFDGQWSGLKIQNNVVVTNHWHGIAVYGATGATIVNNTVMASDPVGHPTWITINPMKTGAHSSNVVVRNNISQTLVIADTGTTYDHNITAGTITDLVSGKSTVHPSGTVGSQNIIMPSITTGFYALNNATRSYDLRLRSNSPAIGFGASDLAPTLDLLGKTRAAPIDAGAYVH